MVEVLREQKELIYSTDWQILVILDACRFDYFDEEVWDYLHGNLEKVWSDGTNTFDWLRNTFPGYYDLTYVSGTPVVHSAEIGSVWYRDKYRGYQPVKHFRQIINAWWMWWDAKLGGSIPQKVTEVALEFTGKRIVHYLQPHAPYIGKTKLLGKKTPDSMWDDPIWEKVKSGKISLELLRKAYRDNLRLVLGEVKRLRDATEGLMVVTADHGEFLGEDGRFQHGDDDTKLTEVPWFVVRR